VERAQSVVDAAEAQALAQKIREDSFTLEDFAEQLRQLKKMGPLEQIMDMVPFFKGQKLDAAELDHEGRELKRFEAIIGSMTREERRQPGVINGERRVRIAKGSGTTVQDVNRLLKQYAQIRKMMKEMKGMGGRMGRKKLRTAMPFLRG
jgi:signal recognition particle subunit SRP54